MQRIRSISVFAALIIFVLFQTSACSLFKTSKTQSTIDPVVFEIDSTRSVLPFYWHKSGESDLKGFITEVKCKGGTCKEGSHLIFKSTRIYGRASKIGNFNILQVPALAVFRKDSSGKETYRLQARKSCDEAYQASREVYIDFNSNVTPRAARQFDSLQASLKKHNKALCE